MNRIVSAVKGASATCPTLASEDLPRFLQERRVPAEAWFEQVPPGVVVRPGMFWLLLPLPRNDISMLLIGTRGLQLAGEAADELDCFYAPEVGEVVWGRQDADALVSGSAYRRDGMPVESLVWVGAVIAAR